VEIMLIPESVEEMSVLGENINHRGFQSNYYLCYCVAASFDDNRQANISLFFTSSSQLLIFLILIHALHNHWPTHLQEQR